MCVPCKRMAQEIFPQKKVGEFYNSNFINISLDADNAENKALVDKFVITSYPAFVFLDARGEIVHRGMDGMTAEEFISLGETAIDTSHNFKSTSQRVKNGDRTPKTLSNYFNFIPYSDEKEKLSIEYLNTLSDSEKLTNTAWMFLKDYVRDIKSASVVFFAKNIKKYIHLFGEKKVEEKMVNLFQNSYNDNKIYFHSFQKHNPIFYDKIELLLKNANQ
ncbi:MAG: thioredoxin family protein [Paludibacteraceae bacterium]